MKTIKLTQGKVTTVDDDLFDELNQFKWCAHRGRKTFYAERKIRLPDGKWATCQMHRFIFELLGEPVPKLVDHFDRDGLNNQWDNLRPATQSEQNRNQDKRIDCTSGYTGVSKHLKSWQVQTQIDYQNHYIGTFADKFSAAWVRDEIVTRIDPHAETNHLVDRRKENVPVVVERRGDYIEQRWANYQATGSFTQRRGKIAGAA